MPVPANPVHHPHGPELAVDSAGDCYMTLRQLAQYSGMSVRSLQRYTASLHRAIEHYRAGGPHGKILVRRSAFDRWLAQWHYRDGRALVIAKLERAQAGD